MISPEETPPVNTIFQAMQSADLGQMPPFDPTSLLGLLQLDGDTPDGKTLVDRLVGEDHEYGDVRAFVGVMHGADWLIDITNAGHENPAQLAVAQAVGAAVVRQITREDDICPGARSLALSSTREDIIPEAIRAKLAVSEHPPEIHDSDTAGMLEALQTLILDIVMEQMSEPGAEFPVDRPLPSRENSSWIELF